MIENNDLNVMVFDDNLYSEYCTRWNNRNPNDAGFDLLCPENISLKKGLAHKINLKVAISFYIDETSTFGAFLLIPRSSISKTPLRLSNSIGLIDSEYRYVDSVDPSKSDCICAVFDAWEDFNVTQYSRLVQVVGLYNNANLNVNLYNYSTERDRILWPNPKRARDGFGSTGV